MKCSLGFLLAGLLPLAAAFGGSAAWSNGASDGDWNHARNWTPETVPNGPSDVAKFATSPEAAVSFSYGVQVGEIDFSAGANATTFTVSPTADLTISGAGVINNSGVTQHFITEADFNASNSKITFTGSATAGTNTLFTALGGHTETYPGGEIFFEDTSSAGHATFEIFGNVVFRAGGASVSFDVNSTAADATFFVYGAQRGAGGSLSIAGTAGAAHITNYRGGGTTISGRGGTCRITNGRGTTNFGSVKGIGSPADAEQAMIINRGSRVSDGYIYGSTGFGGTATAGDAMIVSEGGQADGAAGGETIFFASDSGTPTAGNATLIAEAGVNGGEGGSIVFSEGGDGGTAQFKLFGNGHLDLTQSAADAYNLTIGSLEGDGLVFLDINSLTVGSNNRNTTFAGTIQGSGGVTKIGSGTLVLSGASSYTGGTIVTDGLLSVRNANGSATGAGPVFVQAGTLSGDGIIAGSVTVGSGDGDTMAATISPGPNAVSPGIMTVQSNVALNSDAAYQFNLQSNAGTASAMSVSGVTIDANALFAAHDTGSSTLPVGTSFVVISNTSNDPINGTFANLSDGGTITVGSNTFQANYEGGDGNDLTLTVVP